MEAKSVKAIPRGEGWLYEPKWDGFRCIAFRNGDEVALQSKSGQPLERYFPEVVAALKSLDAGKFVLDGELYIESDGKLDFDALLQRIHPAESRVRKLARETPAHYAVFDLLVDENGEPVHAQPLEARRVELERFGTKYFGDGVSVSPWTADEQQAQQWFEGGMAWFDGVIAKRRSEPYHFGDRDAVVKIKRAYTADCVVGGYRYSKDGKSVASLLLGLYDGVGLLHHVGFLSALTGGERTRARELLEPLRHGDGFTGARPGGVSRWGSRDVEWTPVAALLVVEVEFDHVTGRRFRHGTRFVRWRPDKAPEQCSMDQMRVK
ncbi:MAG: ATP-dependent DNA ligase [Candidatus Eremiobacteraeota bacterium]|nr:ATP-dependent DNA ligase [Candidatus Eremiobacteraeota bacterium]